MILLRTGNKNPMKKWIAILLAVCLMLSAVPAGSTMAEETGVMQEAYKGATFFYQKIRGYKDSVVITGVEITGVTVPEGTIVLEIPEVLGKEDVVSVDLGGSYFVTPDKGESVKDIKKLVLPKNLKLVETTGAGDIKDMNLSYLPKLESIEADPGNKYLKTKDGILYDAGMKTLINYPVNHKATEYKMPSSVTWSLGIINNNLKKITFSRNKEFTHSGFVGGPNLESLYFPDNIEEIGSISIAASSFDKIRWSRNLKVIGDWAFNGCDTLKKVKLPDTVEEIGRNAFRFCQNLEEVTLPSRLRIIHGDAFGDCSKLKKVSPFPKTLAYVVRGAFAKAPAMKKIKKASYLWSSKNSKASKVVGTYPQSLQDRYRYLAIVTVTRGKKTAYYDAQELTGLKPAAKKVTISQGKTKTIKIYPEITNSESVEVKKGWRMKTDILSFTSSNAKVAKVTSKGKIKALKKGKTTITAKMKTSSRKCRIKVTVK